MPQAGESIETETIGARIARARKRRGLLQEGLAQRSNYSRSHIAQVESGHKVATPSFVAAVAAVLHVDAAELFGQPYRGETIASDRVHATIPEIRRALETGDLPQDLDGPPRSLGELELELAALRRLSQGASHVNVGLRLPSVLAELSVHTNESGTARAWALLNATQAVAASLARRLGYTDLAAVGLKAAAASAERGDDPNLPRLAGLSRALLLMTMGAWKQGLTLVQRMGDGLELDTPAARAVYGALQLRAAVLSARAEDASAWDYFGRAQEIAHTLPRRAPDYYGLQFNGPNVALHGVAVAVELRDFDEAIRRDTSLDLTKTGLPAERRSHHLLDMARAHVELGQTEKALTRLLVAERIAPQMIRYHPSARAVVGHLVDMRRELPEPLRGIQTRMGL